MFTIIASYYVGSFLLPFVLIAFIGWVIYEFIFNFRGTMETICGFVLAALQFAWDVVSGLFMSVWDISYIGPLLAIGGTVVVLRFLSVPVFAIIKGVFLAGAFLAFVVGDLISWIPKAGIKNEKTEEEATQVEMAKEGSSSNE